MTDTRELKACPFCGLDVTDNEGCFPINRGNTLFEVRCGNPSCFAHSPESSTHAGAIAKWNARSLDARCGELLLAAKRVTGESVFGYHTESVLPETMQALRKAIAAFEASHEK